jgi:hypothetical protein
MNRIDLELCDDLVLTVEFEAEGTRNGWEVHNWWIDAINGRKQFRPDLIDDRWLDAAEIEGAILEKLWEEG